MASTDPQGADKLVLNVDSSATKAEDPFAGQREAGAVQNGGEKAASPASPSNANRRFSNEESPEWDASKTKPSQFQQRKGSVYATPGSRDGHVERNQDRDKQFHEKVKEFGTGLWGRRRSSKGSADAVSPKKTEGEAEGEEKK